MIETYPFPEGVKSLQVGSDVSWLKGKLIVQPNTRTAALGIAITCQVTSSGTVAALTNTQRDTLLKAFTGTFSSGLSLPSGKLDVYQNDSLYNMRLEARRCLEVEMLGYSDSTTGLARTYAAGTQTVTWTVYAPLSWAEMLDESPLMMGLGYEQMLDSSFQLKCGADPFKAANASLSLAAAPSIRIFPVFTKTDCIQLGLPLMVRDLTNAGSQVIATDPGLVLSKEDTAYALANTDLQTVKVTRGLKGALGLVEADETTPAFIEAAYERAPNTGPTEALNSSYRTALSLLVDQPVKNVTTGKVESKQIIKVRDWQVRVVQLPLLTTQQVLELVAQAAQSLADGEQLIAVSNATVYGLVTHDEQLPYVGFSCFKSSDPRFYLYQGLRCVKGGTPVVHFPDAVLRQYARQCFDALQPGRSYPTGDTGRVENYYQDAARPIPAAITAQEGFTSVSWVYDQVRQQLKDATAELAQKYQQQQQALAAKGVKLTA